MKTKEERRASRARLRNARKLAKRERHRRKAIWWFWVFVLSIPSYYILWYLIIHFFSIGDPNWIEAIFVLEVFPMMGTAFQILAAIICLYHVVKK